MTRKERRGIVDVLTAAEPATRHARPVARTADDRCRASISALRMISALAVVVLLVAWAGMAHADDATSNMPTLNIDLPGDSTMDRFYGEFNDEIPIAVPAFHGVEPKLALHYHSNDGDGFLGQGWSLHGLSQIQRAAPGHGAPTWTSSDIFLLDGIPLVPCAAGSVSPSCTTGGTHSTELESYVRIAYSGSGAQSHWTITQKDGTTHIYAPTFGASPGPDGVWGTADDLDYKWGIYQVIDTHGNTVTYAWSVNQFACCWDYPSSVAYNGTTITFYWEARPDNPTYAMGMGLETIGGRLKTIDVTVSGVRARAYKLSYTISGTTSRSLLTNVQQYGKDATLDGTGTVTGGTAWPATSASYQATGSTGLTQWNWTNGGTDWSNDRVYFGDFNGDGKADILLQAIPTTDMYGNTAGPTGLYMGLSTDTGFTQWTWQDTQDYSTSEIHVADFDGDGKTDLFVKGPSSGAYMALSTGTGFQSGTLGSSAGWTWYQNTNWYDATGACYRCGFFTFNLFFADFNGDGKADMFLQAVPSSGANAVPQGVYMGLSTGTGFQIGTLDSTAGWTWSEPTTNWMGYNILFADFNGDGKADMFLQGQSVTPGWGCGFPNVPGACPIGIYMGLSTGAGFTEWTFSEPNTDWSQYNLFFADFNGDGSADLYRVGKGYQCGELAGPPYYPVCTIGQYMALSTGTGFSDAWSQPAMDTSQYGTVRFGDFDGDKRADVFIHNDQNGYAAPFNDYIGLSTGSGFTMSSWSSGLFYGTGNIGVYDVALRDFNGDGKADIYLHGWGGSVGTVGVGDEMGVCTGVIPDLMTSVTPPFGSTTKVAYTPSSAWSNTYLPFILPAVSSYTIDDGRGNASTTTSTYAGGLYDPIDRRFLGFHYTKTTLPCNPEDNGSCPYEETWFRQDYGSPSKPEQVNRSTGAGTLLTSTVYEYTTNGSTLPYTSLQTGEWHYTYDGTGGTECPGVNCKRTYVQTLYDQTCSWCYGANPGSYGNVTAQINYGDYDVTGDEATAVSLYAPNVSAFITGLRAGGGAYAGVGSSATLMEEHLDYYDGATAWTTVPTVGNPTQELRWLDTNNSWVATGATFDGYGNQLTVTDATGNTTTTTYDATYHVYAATITNALQQTTSAKVWDGACGMPTSDTGPNGPSDVVTTTYDALCRTTQQSKALGGFTQYSYGNIGSPTSQYVMVQTPPADGTTTNQWTLYYFDGRGRTYITATKGPSNIYQVTAYNPRGRVALRTDKYYPSDAPNVTATTYDALDRPLVTTNPDGTQKTNLYVIWATTITDELGHPRTTIQNAYGRKAADRYVIGGVTYQTTYGYDALQRMVSVADANGNTWSNAYDSLGRKTAANDPDLGLWTTAYDANGRVTSRTDAKGQTVSFGYDALNRKTSETMTNPATTYTWTYDQATSGYANIGRLTSQSEPTGNATYNYDLLGRLVQYTKSIDAAQYTFTQGFDAAGKLKWLTYPDGDTLGTPAAPLTYDAAGRDYAIPGVVTSMTYTAYGAPSVRANANGTTTTYAYDSRRATTTISTAGPQAGTLQNLGFVRDADGKIIAITSPIANESWSPIVYDEVDRLKSATNTTSHTNDQAFVYDAVNNMLSNSLVGGYTYPAQGGGSIRPHAATQAGATIYGYDANGAIVARGSSAYGWDGKNRLTSVDAVRFAYDADDKRVMKLGNAPSYFITPHYKVVNGVATKTIAMATQTVATRVGAATSWLHPDQVGSVQVITDAAGQQVNRFYHRPFGDRFQVANDTVLTDDVDFVGERRDIETGLVYFSARYYDPVLGRFVSADPSDPSDIDVGVNRYAYAANDPINRVDDGYDDGSGGDGAGSDGTGGASGGTGGTGATSGTDGTNGTDGTIGANAPSCPDTGNDLSGGVGDLAAASAALSQAAAAADVADAFGTLGGFAGFSGLGAFAVGTDPEAPILAYTNNAVPNVPGVQQGQALVDQIAAQITSTASYPGYASSASYAAFAGVQSPAALAAAGDFVGAAQAAAAIAEAFAAAASPASPGAVSAYAYNAMGAADAAYGFAQQSGGDPAAVAAAIAAANAATAAMTTTGALGL